MSDDLAIGGPGAVSVVTTKLKAAARRLDSLSGDVGAIRRQLIVIDRTVTASALRSVDAPLSAIAAERAIDAADAGLIRCAGASARLARSLDQAADRYAFAETFAARAAQCLAALFGYDLGFFLPLLALMALPAASAVGSALALKLATMSEAQRRAVVSGLTHWAASHKALLSDPQVVELVRLTAMSADDVGAGALHVPFGLSHLLGDEGLGILGLDTSAATVAGLAAPFGALRETPVTVRRVGTVRGGTVATNVEERAGRIPTHGSQVRIDRISAPGQADRFEVYLAGTSDFSLTPGTQAWDMTSNISAVAGTGAGSYRAAQQAMALAGITPASTVVFTGYSQGGLVAARLAASGEYRTAGLITLGGPVGQIPVPGAVPYVALEHREDLVPATGGTFTSSQPVLVRRSLFDGQPPVSPLVFPAHELSRYRETAHLVDASDDPRLTAALRSINGPSRTGATVTSMFYLASRE
ncbi:hypothetical protein GCM10027052_22550 [Parafrigoribacterium mesophilum]|uniref:hypothetical protein n=1 Tax=Parafrigoribacterium mesophilum TaxID=433646 RepID=UPI0031FCC296